MEVRKYLGKNGIAPIDEWIYRLRDRQARARILARIRRLSEGLEGDWKAVGEGVRELRIAEGPGYRVYYAWDGPTLVILLCGGDKERKSKTSKQRSSIGETIMSANSVSTRYDTVDYLETAEDIAAYLSAVIEDGNESVLLAALDDVSRAAQKIMPEASDTQPPGAQAEPSLAQVATLLHALGFELALRRRQAA